MASSDSSLKAPRVGPSARFLLAHPAHFIALGAGSGLSPVAPGTVATLWAWAAFLALQPYTTAFAWALILVLGFAVGCWAAAVSAQGLGVADPGSIVIDEIVAFWLVLWLITPCGWVLQGVAFILFRLFDAIKPGPVGWADRAFHGGGLRGAFGIMFDDLVAAFCTLLLIALWKAAT